MKYGIGIVGVGAFGRFCLESYQSMPEVNIVAVASRSERRAQAIANHYRIPFWTNDYQKLLQQPAVQVVAIFTPPDCHARMAVAAAKAGKHILCEKPLSVTIEEADRIINAVDRYGVAATINYVMRYEALYAKVKSLVRSGQFGHLQRLILENYAPRESLDDNHWLWQEDKSGGLLIEHAVHFFDIFSDIVGSWPIQAASWRPRANEEMAITVYPKDIVGTYYCLFDKPKQLEKNYARFIFERGYAEIDGWIPLSLRLDGQGLDGQHYIYREKIALTKENYYRQLVQAVLRDLLTKISDPNHCSQVTLMNGRDSLAVAHLAKSRQLF